VDPTRFVGKRAAENGRHSSTPPKWTLVSTPKTPTPKQCAGYSFDLRKPQLPNFFGVLSAFTGRRGGYFEGRIDAAP